MPPDARATSRARSRRGGGLSRARRAPGHGAGHVARSVRIGVMVRRPSLLPERLSRRLGVDADLQRVRRHLAAWTEQGHREVKPLLRWQLVSPAKYFRPMTIFTCHRSVSRTETPPPVMLSAIALELFHNVSLVVDDLLDRSRQRRGSLTLHCRFGSLPAWMTSGYLT